MRVNAIAPAARTRMTEATPGLGDIVKAPRDPGAFDVWNPANVSPLVAYLATEGCPLNGRVLFVQGGQVRVFQPWTMTTTLEKDDRWTVDELAKELPASLRLIAADRRYRRATPARSGVERGTEPRYLGRL